MPRFFFDIDDGAAVMRDDEGSDLSNLEAAQREATETLVQMARDVFRSRDQGALSVAIRDESGIPLRRVHLSLKVEDR